MPGAVAAEGARGRSGPPRGRGRGRGGRGRGRGRGRGAARKPQQGNSQQQQQQQHASSPEEVAALKAQRNAEFEARKAAEAAVSTEQAAAAEAAAAAAAAAAAEEAAKPAKLREVEGLNRVIADKKAAPAERTAALEKVVAMAGDATYEPYFVELVLPTLLVCLDDKKVKEVRELASKAGLAIVNHLNVHGTQACVEVIFKGLDDACKWKTKVGALAFLDVLASSPEHQDNFAKCLPRIIPVMMDVLWDTKKEVQAAANKLLELVFNSVDNRDLEPLIPSIISAMGNLSEIPECIQTLASTTFVQTVDAVALSCIVPLLVRGFREKTTAIQRQCCVITTNMSKLVEDAREAAPFLPELIPALERAADAISDPEARAVAERSHEHLLRIKKNSDEDMALKTAEVEATTAAVQSALKAAIDDEHLLQYALQLSTSLCWTGAFAASCVPTLRPYIAGAVDEAKATAICDELVKFAEEYAAKHAVAEEEEETDLLCDTKFTLAYGSKVLLHNTQLKLKRGGRYGLLGGNESGKTTLMRALSEGSVEGFPPRDEVRTVFVEADIQGEISHYSCVNYVLADEQLQALGVTEADAREALLSVSFTEKMLDDAVTTLSGGWRMKLALARAMMQKADLILMDEPTNHLDVLNVQWVVDFLLSTATGDKVVTCIMVSHDSGFLDKTATHILQIKDLKLHLFRGNLSAFVEKNPEARSFFELTASKLKFKFPKPGFLEGVKSKGKALMKMEGVTFTYPGNEIPTLYDITVQVSLSSRVACLGVNGAGKSTLIKILTGQLETATGSVWKHPNAKIAYVAQHAFHHIEQHLSKTANEYIRWRYEGGEDKEGLDKVTMKITEEEQKKCDTPIPFDYEDDNGNLKKEKRVIEKLTGGRRNGKRGFEYEIKFKNKPMSANMYLKAERLEELGFTKHMKIVDVRVEAREGQYARALTQANVEAHLEDVGLDREFGTHNRMAALSGGQKVKVVLAAAMWMQPHILILDEPTNYLDRDALGALAGAIREYEGGVVMVTHNNEFCSALCPETWVLEGGRLDLQGDPDWMTNAMKQKVEFKQIDEMVDGNGNVMKVKKGKKKLSRKEQKARAKKKAHALANGLPWSDSEDED